MQGMIRRALLICAASAVLTACSSTAFGTTVLPGKASAQSGSTSGSVGKYIQHVVIIVQENHSFDNLFAHFPGADGASRGKNAEGQWVKLKKSNLYSSKLLDNSHLAFTVEYDSGKMDGFSAVYVDSRPCPTCAYEYVNPNQIKPYWTMAQQYGLADRMFTSETSRSFNGHQDLIRGDTKLSAQEALIDFPSHGPWGCDAPYGTTTPLLMNNGQINEDGPAPCLTYDTLRDLLDAKQVSWKYYTPPLIGTLAGSYWDAYDAISAVRYGSEWTTNISSPQTNILKDIKKGSLPGVSWVIPDGVDSDHSGFGSTDKGPSWVASVVNAIGASKFWTNRDLRRLGRLGRMVRSTSHHRNSILTASDSRPDDPHFAVCEARLRVAHAIRIRQHRQVRRAGLESWQPRNDGPTGCEHRRHVQLQPGATPIREDSGEILAVILRTK